MANAPMGPASLSRRSREACALGCDGSVGPLMGFSTAEARMKSA